VAWGLRIEDDDEDEDDWGSSALPLLPGAAFISPDIREDTRE